MPTRARMQTLEAVRSATGGGFDADAWHVMDERDSALIADELLSGAGSNKFVYEFSITGSAVSGISVIGARHLAAMYGGIKHRMVGSIEKSGSLFTFTSFPQPGVPMSVQVQVIHELAEEDDFYGAIVEVTDIKTGNSVQMEKRENRMERKRDGTKFERPHFAVIAQSKAYRNAVLALIPQDVQMKWKLQQLQLGKSDLITGSVIEEKRSGVLRFAASKGLSVERKAVEALTMDQISGLSDAAKTGLDAFRSSAEALHVMVAAAGGETTGQAPPPAVRQTKGPAPSAPARTAPRTEPARQANPPQEVGQDTRSRSPDVPPQSESPESTFGVYLVDAFGEVENDGEEFLEPVAFAEALGKLLDRVTPDARPIIMENNREAILAAVDASEEAAALIRTIQAGPPSLVVPVPQARGGKGPAWPPYLKAMRDAVLKLPREQLTEFVTANLDNIRQAPDVQRLAVVKVIGDYANAVGGTVPDILQSVVARVPQQSLLEDRQGRDEEPSLDVSDFPGIVHNVAHGGCRYEPAGEVADDPRRLARRIHEQGDAGLPGFARRSGDTPDAARRGERHARPACRKGHHQAGGI